jgi:YgiT-type zinc finger domain-containing protein
MERAADGFSEQWTTLSAGVLSGMQAWRAQHPRATLQEIEVELDRRLAEGRARLLEHMAQQSAATAWSGARAPTEASGEPEARPRCPECGTVLAPRGRKTRRLKTQGGQELALQREYGVCPQCGQGLFPPG